MASEGTSCATQNGHSFIEGQLFAKFLTNQKRTLKYPSPKAVKLSLAQNGGSYFDSPLPPCVDTPAGGSHHRSPSATGPCWVTHVPMDWTNPSFAMLPLKKTLQLHSIITRGVRIIFDCKGPTWRTIWPTLAPNRLMLATYFHHSLNLLIWQYHVVNHQYTSVIYLNMIKISNHFTL